MTREEAIAKLKEKRQIFIDEWADLDDIVEAFDMAIESIENERLLETKGFERNIKGFEGLYTVNALGKIYSARNDKYLVASQDRFGYLKVNLSKDGKFSQMKVHKIVAETFLGERPNGAQINHIDEDKTNNCVWNLEYVTPSDNINHGKRNEKVADSLRANSMFRIPIKRCDLQGNILEEYASISEASRQTGIAQSNISRSLTGKRKTAGGFIWKKGETI